jgi:hypothetical protein
MSQLTWSRGIGYPGPYNDADFTTDYTGVGVGQWTWNRGLGFAGGYNDSDFTTDPGSPGGDVVRVTSAIDGGLTAQIVELTGIDVIAYAFGGIEGETTSGSLLLSQSDVDYVRVEWVPSYTVRIEDI